MANATEHSVTPWRMRAVQLDLARQRETVPEIGRFARFARDWGFNTLFLYLEGVVRTKSFPYRPRSRSYSLEDMRRIIDLAGDAGLEVVPGLATLAHAEHFVSGPELAHLAERGQHASHTFCPSNPRVYEFLERYLCEIATAFPSRQFHIGGDEVWGLGTCPACRARLRQGESFEDLMLGHVRRVRALLEPFGKRVWIWDDMFENAPESKIAELPRDLVLCAWHYSPELMDRDGLQGHFNNLRRRDWLSLYARLGFDVVVCPAAGGIEGTLRLTELARAHRVWGGLQTVWELSGTFLPAVLPGVALAGALWSGPRRDGEAVFTATLKRLFPRVEEDARLAIRTALTEGLWWPGRPVPNSLRGPLTLEEARLRHTLPICQRLIGRQLRRLPAGLEKDLLEQVHLNLRLQLVAGRQRELLPRLVDPRTSEVERRRLARASSSLVGEVGGLAKLRAKQWRRYRRGIHPDHASAHLRRVSTSLAKFVRESVKTPARSRALLNVRLFLWESYSAPRLRIELRARRRWRTVFTGSFKPVNHRDALYTLQVPVHWRGPAPGQARFTVSGFGGQGISFAALHFARRTLAPSAVVRTHGRVIQPAALLRDDATVCFLGSTNTVRALHQHADHRESSVDVHLAAARRGAGHG